MAEPYVSYLTLYCECVAIVTGLYFISPFFAFQLSWEIHIYCYMYIYKMSQPCTFIVVESRELVAEAYLNYSVIVCKVDAHAWGSFIAVGLHPQSQLQPESK